VVFAVAVVDRAFACAVVAGFDGDDLDADVVLAVLAWFAFAWFAFARFDAVRV
jgi:hypothetical protein